MTRNVSILIGIKSLFLEKKIMLAVFILSLSLATSVKAGPLRFLDLTHTYEDKNEDFFGGQKIFKFDQILNVTSEEFGIWYKAEIYRQNSHTGTHMDAPSHWIPNGINIDEMPVSQFNGPAAVIDITQRARFYRDAEVTIEDLLEWESKIGHSLNGTIVLIRTGWAEKYKDKTEYLGTADQDRNNIHYPGISGSACRWLAANRTIKGLGVDTLSPERGITFFSNHFDCHDALLPKNIFILESVAVKKELPLFGAQLSALPQKIKQGSGAPTRIVASVPEVIHELP